jgi:hypothetical protein
MKLGLAGLGFALLAVFSCASSQRSKGGLTPIEHLSADAVDRALAPKRLALLVGINAFGDPRWPGLKHATTDATALAEVLGGETGGRFDRVALLADPAGVRRAQILDGLDQLAAQNTSVDDTVVVYFSTHGTLSRGPAGGMNRFLVASDSDQDRVGATALLVRELLDRFEALPSQRKLLILAACHSGAGKSALPGAVTRELVGIKSGFFVKPLSEASRASMVLTACGWGETAREDDRLGHDIYTHFFLEALAGKDADGDGAVTATEAHAHAMARTYYFSEGRQRPQVESQVSGADPIVLTGRRTRVADPVMFSYLSRLTGLKVLVDGRDKGSLPGRLVIPPGSHRVVVCEPETCQAASTGKKVALLDAQVEFAPGDQVSVESLLEGNAPGRPEWNLALRAGYQRFFDQTTRAELVAPMPIFELSVSKLGFPLDWMEVGLDLGFSVAHQSFDTGGRLVVEQDLLQLSYGLRLMVRLDLGPLQLLLGPRLAGVHLVRLGVNPDGSNQQMANFAPGLMAQLRLQLELGLSLDVLARAHYMSITTLSDPVDTGFIDLFAGLGWSF